MPKSPKMQRKLFKSACRNLFPSLPVKLVRNVRMKRGRPSMARIFCRRFRCWGSKGMVKYWSSTWISTGRVSRPPVGMWIWECWARRKTSPTAMKMTTMIWTKIRGTKTDAAFFITVLILLFYSPLFTVNHLNSSFHSTVLIAIIW